ncbi:MAG: glycoside hydrolase family 9 protein [Clostridiales bacterium]|nr:glycoside hydrolase family 9 protein [Clostridiales bacterium]
MEHIKKFLSLTVSLIILLSFAGTALAGQQLGATDFDDGVGLPWHIVESATGKMDFAIEDGKYKITIINPGGASNGGEDRWDCQFRHRGLTIVAGHEYHVHYEITSSNSGKYYTKIGNLDGNVEVWHNMSNGYDLDSTWDLIPIGAGETRVVDLTFTAGQTVDVAEWAFHLGGDGQYTNGVCFPAGTVIEFDNMSLEDLTSDENDYVAEVPRERADIMTNQVGYLPGCEKTATLLSDSPEPVTFYLKDQSGQTVYTADSRVFGYDEDSGDEVHILDFSGFDGNGTYYLETEEGAVSREFSVGLTEDYSELLYDSLNYFYQNRSGIAIESGYISSGDVAALARSAGHAPDNATILTSWDHTGNGGMQDVTGGWYDAGDHGKYVVNGGIALWLLQNLYETSVVTGTEAVFADGTMNIPESGNGFPDLLDESRWEMEWMFTMLVADGEYKDMVYHKVHDCKWTGLGLAPGDDDLERVILPPTTAATLNVSACAAQASRLWKDLDPDFSSLCLDISQRTFEAALSHPDMYAPLDDSDMGGGAYGDDDVTDEFYWAACELYITTGDDTYLEYMESSPCFASVPSTLAGGESVDTAGCFDWGHVASLGTMSAALNPSLFDDDTNAQIRNGITSAADVLLEREASQGYGQPYGPSVLSSDNPDTGYVWGSNSFVADNSIVLCYAYCLTGETAYLDGASSGLDYLLGRNPMDLSYVTGYGTYAAVNPHHRFWANQVDASFPQAPAGVLVGGPNCGMEDPWVRGSGWHYGEIPPAKCYMDNIEAYSVNECTINWNAPLSWIVFFITSNNGGVELVSSPEGNSGEFVSSNVERTDERGDEKVTSGEGKTDHVFVVILSALGVILVVSLEIFIYKMAVLKRDGRK